jgi:hypothetical protein
MLISAGLNIDDFMIPPPNGGMIYEIFDRGCLKMAEIFIEMVLKSGKDLLEVLRSQNNHALTLSTRRGHTKVVQLLLSKGLNKSDILCKNNTLEYNSLVSAAYWGRADILRIFLGYGITVNDIKQNNNFIFHKVHESRSYNSLKILRKFVRNGLSP